MNKTSKNVSEYYRLYFDIILNMAAYKGDIDNVHAKMYKRP